MFFSAPDAASLVGEFTIAVTAQLGDGAVAGHWKVDIYNRDTNSWDNKGDLAGGELVLFLVVFSCLGSNTCFPVNHAYRLEHITHVWVRVRSVAEDTRGTADPSGDVAHDLPCSSQWNRRDLLYAVMLFRAPFGCLRKLPLPTTR